MSCEAWEWFAANARGLDSDRVSVHTPCLGGGFGRRAETDVIVQAVMSAAKAPDVAVPLISTSARTRRGRTLSTSPADGARSLPIRL